LLPTAWDFPDADFHLQAEEHAVTATFRGTQVFRTENPAIVRAARLAVLARTTRHIVNRLQAQQRQQHQQAAETIPRVQTSAHRPPLGLSILFTPFVFFLMSIVISLAVSLAMVIVAYKFARHVVFGPARGARGGPSRQRLLPADEEAQPLMREVVPAESGAARDTGAEEPVRRCERWEQVFRESADDGIGYVAAQR
jgi:hypothetical protein